MQLDGVLSQKPPGEQSAMVSPRVYFTRLNPECRGRAISRAESGLHPVHFRNDEQRKRAWRLCHRTIRDRVEAANQDPAHWPFGYSDVVFAGCRIIFW